MDPSLLLFSSLQLSHLLELVLSRLLIMSSSLRNSNDPSGMSSPPAKGLTNLFRPTKFCLLLACFYRVLVSCSVPSSVIHITCLFLGQLFVHTQLITALIDKLEDFFDSFFLLGYVYLFHLMYSYHLKKPRHCHLSVCLNPSKT